MEIKTAIETGDAGRLRRLLDAERTRANALVRWGKNGCNRTHPLHYVSDKVFDGTLPRDVALPLIDVLLAAGADVNFQTDGKGDTPLIGAASLGAEEVGLRLLEAGAQVERRGLFGETALHWAALLGEEQLAARLIPRADLTLRDERYHATPPGWAIEGWTSGAAGSRGRYREVVALLIAAGAPIEPRWFESDEVRANPTLLAVLRAGDR